MPKDFFPYGQLSMQLFSSLSIVPSLIAFTLALALPAQNTPAKTPDISIAPRSALPDTNTKTPGLNCNGSFYCTIYTGNFIQHAYRLATVGLPPKIHPSLDPKIWNLGPMNDTAFYATGHHAL
ncbi:MAG: hypothetical protein Q9226_007260, partial [Calogaya cf. arnoldii]